MSNQLSGIWIPCSCHRITLPERCRIHFTFTEKQNCLSSGKKSRKCMKTAQTPAAKAGDTISLKRKQNKSYCEHILLFCPRKRSPTLKKKIFRQNSLRWEKSSVMKHWIGNTFLNFTKWKGSSSIQ